MCDVAAIVLVTLETAKQPCSVFTKYQVLDPVFLGVAFAEIESKTFFIKSVFDIKYLLQ